MGYAHIPHPDDWVTTNGLGNCFHAALSRWALLRDEGETGWKVAIAVVKPLYNGDRHIHAWLQHGERVLMVDGSPIARAPYYEFMGVERNTVRLVNPRSLLRRCDIIDRSVIDALLDLSGLPCKTNDQGGVVPS